MERLSKAQNLFLRPWDLGLRKVLRKINWELPWLQKQKPTLTSPSTGSKVDNLLHLAESSLTGGYLHSTYFWVSVIGLGLRDAVQNLQSRKEILLKDALDTLARFDELQHLVSKEHLAYNRTLSNSLTRLKQLSNQVTARLVVRDPKKLLVGAEQLAYVQQKHRWYREGIQKRIFISEEELYGLDRLMQFCAASYGYKMLHFFGLAKPGMTCNRTGIQYLAKVDASDVLVLEESSKVFRPGHFVCVDHDSKRVVVVVRGTIRLQDALTDLICDDIAFRAPGVEKGRVHEGFLRAAQTLALELHDTVHSGLVKYPGYSLTVTGHSMGGAVASILALIWGQMKVFQDRNVQGYSFAAPCCMNHELARSPFVRKCLTSVVLGDDFICRLSLVNTQILLESCDILARNEHLSCVEKYWLVEKVRKKAHTRQDRMFPGGLVYNIPLQHRFSPDRFDVHLAEEIDPTHSLGEIVLTPKMLDVHLPSRYLNAIRMQHTLRAKMSAM